MKITKITSALIFVFLLLPCISFAQKVIQEIQTQISYDVKLNGPQTGSSSVMFDKAKLEELTSQIREAKTKGDVLRIQMLNSELESITGNNSIHSSTNNNGPQVVGEVVNLPIEGSPTDYNSTLLSNQGF